MQAITPRQREILLFITQHKEKNGYAPSFSEIMESLGISSRGHVHRFLVGLEKKGFIHRPAMLSSARAARAIQILQPVPA